MRAQLTSLLGAMRWPWAMRAGENLFGGRGGRGSGPSIAQLIAALDDRDTRNALDLLDPPPASSAVPVRRIKCAGGCRE